MTNGRDRGHPALPPLALLVAGLALVGAVIDAGQKTEKLQPFRTALTEEGRGIVRRPPPYPGSPGILTELPAFDPERRESFQVDLRGKDLSALDVRGRLTDLLLADFDDLTRWPAGLPEGFAPRDFMEMGKNPGLRVRELHKAGITGRGVGVAVIDMGFLVDHAEYKDRLRLFEEIHSADETAQMHGVATASIAVGRTVGVAPEADLYYIAYFPSAGGADGPGSGRDFTWAAQAIDRVLEVSRRLPGDRRIRVISMSIGWGPKETGYREVMEAVERAKRDGIFVACTTMDGTYGFKIFGLSRDPRRDPDDVASYGEAWWGGLGGPGMKVLHFPIDSRTTASPTGPSDYAFYRRGGLSWAVPWAAGLYALACQVRPDITPELFWEKAQETGDSLDLPPKEPTISEEEIERRIGKIVDDGLARVKSQTQGQDAEAVYAKIFSQYTNEKKDRMSESDFRAWSAERVRPMVLEVTKPRKLERVVDPVRLIGGLRR